MIANVLIALTLVVGATAVIGPRSPGMSKSPTEGYLRRWHQEVVIKEMERKLNETKIEDLSGNLTTVRESTVIEYELKDLELKRHSRPKAEISIRKADGIWLTVHISKLVFEGKYDASVRIGNWHQFSKKGELDLTITDLKIRMKRDARIVGERSTLIRWESREGTVLINQVDFDLHDAELNSRLASVGILHLKEEIGRHLLKVYKNLTEAYYDATIRLTDDLFVDTLVMRNPDSNNGWAKFLYHGEIRHKGDNRIYKEFPGSLLFDNQFPQSDLEVKVTDYTFKSLAFVTHNNGLLNSKFSKDDLPEGQKNLLDTTCDRGCIGKLLSSSGLKPAGTSVELSVATTSTKALRFTIVKDKLTLDVDLQITARVRGDNSPTPLFVALYKMTSEVQVTMRQHGKLHLHLLRPFQSATILQSKITTKPKPEDLLTISQLALQKRFLPVITHLAQKGIQTSLPDFPYDSEVSFEDKVMRINVDYHETREETDC